MTRRTVIAVNGALPTIAGVTEKLGTGQGVAPRDVLLRRYSSWLWFERRRLMREMYPDRDPNDVARFVPEDRWVRNAFFPVVDDVIVDAVARASDRAAIVLAAAGIHIGPDRPPRRG